MSQSSRHGRRLAILLTLLLMFQVSVSGQNIIVVLATPTPTSPSTPVPFQVHPLPAHEIERRSGVGERQLDIPEVFDSFTSAVGSVIDSIFPGATGLPDPASYFSSLRSAESSFIAELTTDNGAHAFSVITAGVGSFVSSISADIAHQTQASKGGKPEGKVLIPLIAMLVGVGVLEYL